MASKEAYSDDRIYDDFELNTKPVDSPSKKKNDAPWQINREKASENDTKRLLEYERSFKNDQFIDPYPDEIETQAKTVRSLQRKQMKFDENYSKWAYDDEYDDEDKSDGKSNAPYDPEQAYSESGSSRLFGRERFSNPETAYNELLAENYPNSDDLRPYKVGKIRVENKLEEKLKASLKEPKTPRTMKNEDEDIIILDDTLPTVVRERNEINKKIKISFNAEHKSKSIIQDSVFNDDKSPDVVRVESKSEPTQSLRKIPVLETSNIPTVTPTAPTVRPVTPGPPIISSAAPITHFSNPPYPMMDRNYYNNSFGGNVISEMHVNRNFMPEATTTEFYPSPAAPPGSFPSNMSWIPVAPTSSVPPSAVIVDNVPNSKEPQKGDKVTSEDAVKEEIRQQNKKLMDQRDQYLQKYNSLNEELSKLKKQKKTLSDKKSHQVEEFLRENNKLQNEVMNKIKAVKNVIDMLSKIIKDEGMKGSAESPDEGSKKNSVERDDNAKEHHKKKRKHSRSRSKSRHRSRSRSRSRRSRSRSRHRSRSRSRSPRSRYRRRSRSRDKYYRRRRSHSRDRKKGKRDKEEKSSSNTAASSTPAVPATVVEPQPPVSVAVEPPVVVEKPKEASLSDRFKSSFEEILSRAGEPPKAVQVQKFISASVELPVNAIPAVSASLEKTRPVQQLPVSKGWARNTTDTVNYVYYDPEIHWCRVCNVFPKTAKEYLLHLHSPEHKQVIATKNLIDYPWHKNQTDTKKPTNPAAPTERIPIRGLPFFVSATAWYCKLCDQWMGDLHCASAHLKSDEHENNYMTFLESNPKWEDHWIDSRAKAHQMLHAVKAPEIVTPAYSMETYIKSTPTPPPPPPLQLRPGGGDKKRSLSTSSSSSGSSSSSSSSSGNSTRKKKKKNKRNKDRKRSVEKETKFKMVVTDAKRARELAKKPPIITNVPQPVPANASQPSTVSFNVEEEDKFVQEWMSTVRSKSKEKDFQELKNKLSKKKEAAILPAPPPPVSTATTPAAQAPEKAKVVLDASSKKSHFNRRSPERERSRRDDDYRSDRSRGNRFEDRSRRSPRDDSRYKRTSGSDSRSSDKYKSSGSDRGGSKDGKSGAGDTSKKSESGNANKKTVIDRRFLPFIGKMPSKNVAKKVGEQQHTDTTKTKPDAKVVEPKALREPTKTNDQLSESIQKQLADYDRPKDVDVAVVDMDINEDEDEPVSIVVDDNISRKKDFDETLKLLYPEDKPKPGPGGPNLASQMANAVLPANLSQDYLVSLIRSTIKEKQLTLNDGNENSKILQIASSMKEILFNNTNVADIPIPLDDRPIHISSEEQLYNVPLPEQPSIPGVEEEPEPAPPGTAEDLSAIKKKKNPISQKKRRQLRKIREKLEEQEKLLQQKIEECKNQTETSADDEGSASASASGTADEAQQEMETSSPPPGPVNVMDSDLMMLGIDEGDSAALLF